MFRIIINRATGRWEVQLQFLFMWRTISDWSFKTYDEAVRHTNSVGIGEVYTYWKQP